MTRSLFIATLLVTACAQTQHPNLTGTWELNLEKSDFAKEVPPARHTDSIDHNDPDISFTATRTDARGTNTGTLRYKTDGTEVTNTVFGTAMKGKAAWEGEVLIIESRGRFGDNEIRLVDRYTLAPDKQTLTVERHYEGRGGPQDQKLILDRK